MRPGGGESGETPEARGEDRRPRVRGWGESWGWGPGGGRAQGGGEASGGGAGGARPGREQGAGRGGAGLKGDGREPGVLGREERRRTPEAANRFGGS